MKLMLELSEQVQTITESIAGKKTYFIEGIFTGVKPNRNNRVYPKSILESALNKFQPVIQAKRALGELQHPSGPQINLDRVSHIIESMKWSGDEIIGRAKILDTPMGLIAQKLLEGGAQLGVSTRGLGSIKPLGNGLSEVQHDYTMNTVDIVGDPSYGSAFVNGLLEGREWFVTQDGKFEEQTIDQLKKRKITEERKIAAFKFFVEALLRE